MKQRWITFHEWGGEVVKGEEPSSGPYILAPICLPLHIPMQYWKLQDGAIVEMNDDEKLISDLACQEQPVQKYIDNKYNEILLNKELPIFTDILGLPEEQPLEIIDLDEIVQELKDGIQEKIDAYKAEHKQAIYDISVAALEEIDKIEQRLIKGDDKFKDIKQALDEYKQEADKHINDVDEHYRSIIESIESEHEKVHNNIMHHIKEQDKQLEIYEAMLDKDDERLRALEQHPKVEKFFIVNNFATKEYLQILVTSGLLYVVLQLLFK